MNGSLAFTWSPKPDGICVKYQHNSFIPSLNNLKLCCSSYEIYPELNLNGNIHYHGILVIKDWVKWYKKVLPSFKYLGHVLIKKDPNKGWIDYMSKDCATMQKVLNIPLPIMYNNKL